MQIVGYFQESNVLMGFKRGFKIEPCDPKHVPWELDLVSRSEMKMPKIDYKRDDSFWSRAIQTSCCALIFFVASAQLECIQMCGSFLSSS